MALGTTNITTTLVGTTIGSASRDVGSLCSSPLINKWSKYKPVRLNKLSGLTSDDFKIVNYGLVFGELSYYTPIEASSVSVTYNKPRGGDYMEHYRIGDFRNYDHLAIPPISGLIDLTVYQKYDTKFNLPYLISTSDPNGTNISLEDILFLSNMYICISIYNSSNIFICYKTSSEPISVSSLGNMVFYLSDLGSYSGTAQTLKYFVCACSNKHDVVSDPYPINDFRPLPFSSYLNATKNIVIDTSFGLSVDPIGINRSVSIIYEDINNYSAGIENLLYYNITSDGNLNIVYNFIPERNISIELWQFTHYANHNFVDNNPTGDIPCSIYDISAASPSLLSGTFLMEEGITYRLLFVVPNFMKYSNGILMSNMVNSQKEIVFSVKYKNILLWQVLDTCVQF